MATLKYKKQDGTWGLVYTSPILSYNIEKSGDDIVLKASNGTSSTITDAIYTHPTYTARTGKPTANQTPSFGGTATVSQITSDGTGHVTGMTDRTITIPSTLSNGTGTAGLIKTSSAVTSSSGYTACPVINGVPYYKDTNDTYSLSSFGITATAAELNKLDGVTATATELNYVDGVTSNIQTQLNAKVPISRTINGKGLSSNITLSASDVSAYSKTEIDDMEFITVADIDAICGTTIQVATTSEVKF